MGAKGLPGKRVLSIRAGIKMVGVMSEAILGVENIRNLIYAASHNEGPWKGVVADDSNIKGAMMG